VASPPAYVRRITLPADEPAAQIAQALIKGDLRQRLNALRVARGWIDQEQEMLVLRARGGGVSWQALACDLGVSRQALQKRYGGASAAGRRAATGSVAALG